MSEQSTHEKKEKLEKPEKQETPTELRKLTLKSTVKKVLAVRRPPAWCSLSG